MLNRLCSIARHKLSELIIHLGEYSSRKIYVAQLVDYHAAIQFVLS
jgi:hypothetical protein